MLRTLIVTLVVAPCLYAQTTTWGGGFNSNWNNPANWSAGVPDANTNATIEPAANQPSMFDADPVCKALRVKTGATVAVGIGRTLTVTGDLLINDGGTLVTIEDSSVAGDVDIGLGTWNIGAGSHVVVGDVTVAGGFVTGAGRVELVADGQFSTTAGGSVTNVLVSDGLRTFLTADIDGDLEMTGGTIRILDDSVVTVADDGIFTGGVLEWRPTAAGGLDVLDIGDDAVVTCTSGTSNPDARFRVHDDWSSSDSFALAEGVVELDGPVQSSVGGASATFPRLRVAAGTKFVQAPIHVEDDLVIDDDATLSAEAIVTVDGNVTLAAAATWELGAFSHPVAGNWSSIGGSATGTGRIDFVGDGAVVTSGGGVIENVRVSAGARLAGTCTIADDLFMNGGSLTVDDDALVVVLGNVNLSAGTFGFTPSLLGGEDVLDAEGTVRLTCATGTTTANSVIRCGGDWSSNSNFAPTAGTVRLDGPGFHDIGGDPPSFDPTFAALAVDAGVHVASNDFSLDFDTLTVAQGAVLDVDDQRVAVPGSTITVDGQIAVDGGGELALGPAVVLTVAPTGTLNLLGDQGDPATVAGEAGGGYALTIDGRLTARFFAFREMGPDGIVIPQGALFAPFPNDMRGGVFSDPAPGGALLSLERATPKEFRYVDFELGDAAPGAINVATAAGAAITFVNSEGDLAGEAFDDDPLDLVAWLTEETVVSAELDARAGVETVTLGWETSAEIDTAEWVLRRAVDELGPFADVNTFAPGGSPYGFVDSGVVAGTTYFYELVEVLDYGEEIVRGAASATPWSAALPSSVFDVGPSGTYADVQTALAAAAGTANPIVTVDGAGGPYLPFIVEPPIVGTLRVLGTNGVPQIDTTLLPVTIRDLTETESVELSDLAIGDGVAVNIGITIANCAGIVVLDELDVAAPSGDPAVRVSASDRVAIQRCDLSAGFPSPDLRVREQSDVVLSGIPGKGSLDRCLATDGSRVRSGGLDYDFIAQTGATVEQLPGAHADLEMPDLAVLNTPFDVTFTGEPGGTWLLVLSLGYAWVDLKSFKWELVGIANLSPFGTIASGPLPGGTLTLPFTLPDEPALLGVPIVMQTVVLNGILKRWSNVAAVTGLPQ